MRLFLSSYRTGGHDTEFLELLDGIKEIAVITNAKDYKSAEERKASVNEVMGYFSAIGLEPKEVDLRQYFTNDKAIDELSQYEAIWVAGGNTFLLRRALKQAGCDSWLTGQVHQGAITYAGESAGAVLPTPTLAGVQYGDDPNIIPPEYNSEIIWKGLSLVPYCIVPHYESEWVGAVEMLHVLEHKGIPFKTLRDDQAIVIDGDQEKII